MGSWYLIYRINNLVLLGAVGGVHRVCSYFYICQFEYGVLSVWAISDTQQPTPEVLMGMEMVYVFTVPRCAASSPWGGISTTRRLTDSGEGIMGAGFQRHAIPLYLCRQK